jgi:hypothetical protein
MGFWPMYWPGHGLLGWRCACAAWCNLQTLFLTHFSFTSRLALATHLWQWSAYHGFLSVMEHAFLSMRLNIHSFFLTFQKPKKKKTIKKSFYRQDIRGCA